ncbi:MAG: DUF192 domain-containing protein [Candidatus Omnitrophota bacterium]
MIIANLSTQEVVAHQAVLADTTFTRMKGLLGRTGLKDGEALVITQCNSIHMFFMKFPIDVIFVDASWQVVGLVRAIKPFGLSPVFWKAVIAVEMNAGTIDRLGLSVGQQFYLDKSKG